MKQVIAALILMFLVGALFGTVAFTNAVETAISGAVIPEKRETPLFTQYHALYQRADFELNTFIDLKYKDNLNRFGIWDYLYPVTREGRTVSIKRVYSSLLKVYVRAAGTKDAEGRGKDRYFILVEAARGKAVYEVTREADFREILKNAVASHGRSDVERDIIYDHNFDAVKVYLPKPDPDPVPTTCTNCRTLQLRIASLENTIEEMKRIAEEREAEIERLKWERKLIIFIAIVFLAALVVVVIALLRVKSQLKKVMKDREENETKIREEIEAKLRTKYEERLKKIKLLEEDNAKLKDDLKLAGESSKNTIAELQQEKESMQATIKTKDKMIDEQAGKLASYEQSIKKYEPELHTLRQLEQKYLEVREVAGKMLVPKQPKEEVTPEDLKFVIEELAKEMEKRTGIIRTKEEEIVRLKEKIETVSAETAAVREEFGIGDTPLKDYIAAIIEGKKGLEKQLEESNTTNSREKKSLTEALNVFFAPKSREQPVPESIPEICNYLKSSSTSTGIGSYRDLTAFLLGIISPSEFSDQKSKSFRHKEISLFEGFYDAQTRKDVGECLKKILTEPEKDVETYIKESLWQLTRLYNRFYMYYSFLMGVDRCAAKDTLHFTYINDIELFKALHSLLEEFSKEVAISVEIALPFVENTETFGKDFTPAAGPSIKHVDFVVEMLSREYGIELKTNLILEILAPIVRSEFSYFRRDKMSIHAYNQT